MDQLGLALIGIAFLGALILLWDRPLKHSIFEDGWEAVQKEKRDREERQDEI